MASKTISGVIYGLYIDNRWYVGLSRVLDKTGYPKQRMNTHQCHSKKENKLPVHSAIAKYGFPTPVILERIVVDVSKYDEELIDLINEEMAEQEENMNDDCETVIMDGDESGPLKELIEKLNEAECKWIKLKNSMVSWKGGNGYNVQPGGGSFDHITPIELVKKREDKQVEIAKRYIEFVNKSKRQIGKTDDKLIYLCYKHWLASVKGIGAHILYPKTKELLDKTFPGWSYTLEEKQHQKVTLLHDFFKEYGRLPAGYRKRGENTPSESRKEEDKLAEYLHTFKFARQRKLGIITKGANCIIFESTEKMLNELIPIWYKSMNEIALENCQKIIDYHKENGYFPKYKTELGNIYRHFKNEIISKNIKRNPYDTISKMLDDYDIKWRTTNKSKQDELVDTIIEFIEDNKRIPISYSNPKNDTEKYEQYLAKKITGFRSYLNGGGNQSISSENKKRLDDAFPTWYSQKK